VTPSQPLVATALHHLHACVGRAIERDQQIRWCERREDCRQSSELPSRSGSGSIAKLDFVMHVCAREIILATTPSIGDL